MVKEEVVLFSLPLLGYNHSCFLDPDLLGTCCPEEVTVLPCCEDFCVHLHVLISFWALFLLRGWRAVKLEGGRREFPLCLTDRENTD